MSDIKKYDEMNKQICGLLRLAGDNVSLYAAQRIAELEAENSELCTRLHNAVELKAKVGDMELRGIVDACKYLVKQGEAQNENQ